MRKRKHTKQVYNIVVYVEIIKDYPRTVNKYFNKYWNKRKIL